MVFLWKMMRDMFSFQKGRPVSKKYQKVAGLFSMESIVFAIDLVFMEVTD